MKTPRRRLCVVTGTRADYGLLRWLIHEIKGDPRLELQLIATGSHLSPTFGNTVTEITDDGVAIDRKIHVLVDGDDHIAAAKSIGLGIISFADALAELAPDMLVVLGDRFEILAAATAAYTLRIPVAHIHGGETTGGALDEGYRHAITKMSSLHFVAAQPYRTRVMQMGETPATVFCVGAPGVEAIHRYPPVTMAVLRDAVGLPLEPGKYLVIAWHPATGEDDDGMAELDCLLQAVDALQGPRHVVISKSNADPSGRRAGMVIDAYVAKRPERTRTFTSLGHRRFLALVKNASLLLGNSSSGIIEAPALGVPTVNIGRRQAGRLRAGSIIDVIADGTSMGKALDLALSPAFKQSFAGLVLPYGDGTGVASKIKTILADVDLAELRTKAFTDLPVQPH